MAEAMKDDSTDQIFSELLDIRKNTDQAVDAGRGYMFLNGYLLEDERLENVLHGKTLVADHEWGLITVNRHQDVKDIAQTLDGVTEDSLTALAEAYHQQVPRLQAAPTPKKQGLLSRLFGGAKTTTPIETAEPEIDPGLISLFAEIKVFYKSAAETQRCVFCAVYL